MEHQVIWHFNWRDAELFIGFDTSIHRENRQSKLKTRIRRLPLTPSQHPVRTWVPPSADVWAICIIHEQCPRTVLPMRLWQNRVLNRLVINPDGPTSHERIVAVIILYRFDPVFRFISCSISLVQRLLTVRICCIQLLIVDQWIASEVIRRWIQ